MSDLCVSPREALNMVNSLTDGWGKKKQLLSGWMGWVRAWPVVNWAGWFSMRINVLVERVWVCLCFDRGWCRIKELKTAVSQTQNSLVCCSGASCDVTKILGITRDLSTLVVQLWSLLSLFSWVQLTLYWNQNTLIGIIVLNVHSQNNNWLIVKC